MSSHGTDGVDDFQETLDEISEDVVDDFLNSTYGGNLSSACRDAVEAIAEHITESFTEELESKGILNKPEAVASLSIMLILTCLLISLIIGQGLKRANFHFLHVAGAALLLGILIGGIIVGFVGRHEATRYLVFKESFFFLVVLPPIIFESGWAMKRRPFFRNLGAIAVFAFIGTTLSTFFVGGFLTIAGKMGMAQKLPALHNFVFGSLISATDPVTTLAIFGDVGANENLFAVVFGESVLNDAVAIVLFRTLMGFKHEPVSFASIMKALGTFLMIFIGSFIIGAVMGILATVTLRKGHFRTAPGDDHNALEVSLVVIYPYIAYMLADGFLLSGIVSVLFCGIIMGYYTKMNMSEAAEHWAFHFFKLMASLAELFVFIYMGMSVFLIEQSFRNTGYFICTLIACLIGRALHIYPGSILVNNSRRKTTPERVITPSFMHMLWYSGLRGAVAFALAIGTIEELDEHSGKVILSATVFMVVFTVLVFGGSTFTMLKKLKLRATDDAPGSGNAGVGEFKRGKVDLEQVFADKWVTKLCNPVFVDDAKKREASHGHVHGADDHHHDHDHDHDHHHHETEMAVVNGGAAPAAPTTTTTQQ